MATTSKPQTQKIVLGKVTDSNDRPLANLKVEIFDVDMREWQPLADTFTDKQGKYELQWTHDQLSGRGMGEADIAIKVFTKENKTELFKSSMDEVRFNASEREEININIKQALPAEVVEFDFLVKEVTFLAGKVAIAELQENKQHQDVTFLSKELEVPAEKIEHLVVAHRLQNLSKIEPAFFYAILRKNTLLHNNFAKNLKARFSIGINAEDKMLLFDAALLDEKTIETDIKTAIDEKIVSSKLAQNIGRDIEILAKYRKEAEAYYQNDYAKNTIQLLIPIFKKEKLDEVNKLFQENKNNLNVFFEKVVAPSFFESKNREKDAKMSIELSKFLGFGNEVIPQVIKSNGIKKPEDIRKLAKLNKTEWVKEISSANPALKDKQLIGNYASTIVRKFEKTFPTTAFAAQLEREKKSILHNQEKIVSFFSTHEDFDLTKDNLDLFLKKKKVTKKEKEAISEELKAVQRVFKLIPHYGKTNALRNEKIHSAQSIVAMGKTRFVKDIAPKTGLSDTEAKDIFLKAETKHTAAMLMVGDLQDSMSVMDIASFETTALAKKLEAVSKDFPNLKSLFKLVDTCECEHCRSVYSPAAYLVEILQFLKNRNVVAGNAQSELFKRRPDLGDIDLSCANANTPVKYIDLVCELLENAIAQDPGIDFVGNLSDGADPLTGKISNALFTALQAARLPVTTKALIHHTESGLISSATLSHYLRDTKLVCKIENTGVANTYKIYRLRQTLSTAEELDAAPEYVNTEAYEELRTKFYAFKLPFDLNHTEAKAYFNRFDIKREDLMRDFQSAGNPINEAIAVEKLGLTDSERNIIITPKANLIEQQLYWNAPAQWDTPPLVGSVVDYMKRVDHFLNRTELTYKELDLLLKLNFIDKNKNLFIKNLIDLSCDTEKKVIANFDINALDRIHRFLRLQKKTGWKFEILDAIISQAKLGNGQLDDACLVKAAQLKEISEKTGNKLEELIGCFGEMPHIIYDEDAPKPLYQQIFLNKAKNGNINEGLLPDKVDGSQLLNPYLGYISTCIQLKQKDLELLLQLLPDGNLTFSNLSYLFAASRLAKKLKLKAEDFVSFTQLSGIDFSITPQKALDFIKAFDDFKNSPLKLSDVKFLLNHEATNLNDREIKDTKIIELLGKLKTEYSKIIDANSSKFDSNLKKVEEYVEVFTSTLSGLENITENDVKTILKFLNKDWTDVTNAAGAKAFIDDKFDKGIIKTAIKAAIDALDAVPAGTDSSAEQLSLIKEILDAISVFATNKNKQTFLGQTLSTAFKSDADLVSIVLKYAKIKQPAPGTDLILTLLSDDFSNPIINEANFQKQFRAVRLLHKMFPAINVLKLSITDIEWYLKNNSSLGWFEFDSIPYEVGQVKVFFSKYVEFTELISFTKQYTPVANPSDIENSVSFFSIAEMLVPPITASRADFLQTLAFLTGYEIEDLDGVDAHLYAAFSLTNYQNIENLVLLLKCTESLRKLSATVSQVVAYIKPMLTAADVNDLRATLKSKYDEDTWLSTLKEIMDAIRPQKRDALIVYLLATNPDIKDKNDLYEYLLVDVEMEACMPSSRIVQAHNSTQLFVQRCLMGLEPNAIANLDSDPNWDQWKWMKNYRVWEANRKVFLYPENWYDVTLSDDKTYLLTEFINEIQQNELTNDTAEEALKKYLEKLDNIAFLEVMATWYDVPTRDMHVFARTKGGDPSIYYYRRFENERSWTPWEKVELDITGDHLLAFKRNNRLCLAWPMFSEEADPNQGAKLPNQSVTTEQPIEKPRKKLKIQLAISEYTDKKWQPKRVSKDAIQLPPNGYFTAEIMRDKFQFFYNEFSAQINLYRLPEGRRYWNASKGDYDNEIIFYWDLISGAFDITGCKGYPEVATITPYAINFIPKFLDTDFSNQRYKELFNNAADDLSVINAHSFISGKNYDEILKRTPGIFRVSYPHQFTIIDMLAFLFERVIYSITIKLSLEKRSNIPPTMPIGTLLPYFMEDSNHAYVIIPGFYTKKMDGGEFPTTFTLNDSEKRTASDVFQLIDDITNWLKKMQKQFKDNPPADLNAAIHTIITDEDFQKIMMKMSKYEALDFILKILVGKIDNDKFDEQVNAQGLVYGEEFKNMSHPLVCALRSILYKDGIPALMKRETQMQKTNFDFETYYQPNHSIVSQSFYKKPDGTLTASFPIDDVDFMSDGSYSAYNWDLFFRVPLHIAGSLTKNQRFEEALTWFHYMFNPTGALPGTGVQKYWVTKPFYLNQDTDYLKQRIDTLMYAISNPLHPNVPAGASSDPVIRDLEFAISEWRNKPFQPDVVMRFRPVAYQKALLMKYLDNLMEWGDYLFRQDTMESIAQATQMYILADKLLGPKPRVIPPIVKAPYETYNQIERKLDSFGNALVELENILPDLSVLPEGGSELPPSPITLSMLYFCIPANDNMMAYWNRVGDRLFKIRHCQNIDGVERSLALFAPPIDPGMLVRAAASGLDISAVIAGLNAPTPYYRFNVLVQKATELAQEVRGLGNSLLQALEKKDGEAMALLRSELELKVLNAVKDIKILQINESKEQIEVLKRTKIVTEERQRYYRDIDFMSPLEITALGMNVVSTIAYTVGSIMEITAGASALVPDGVIGASGFGGSPVATFHAFGGEKFSSSVSHFGKSILLASQVLDKIAGGISTVANYQRRNDDWKFQERLANKELDSIEKQISAAEIRKTIAETDLKNHELQIENANKTDQFMRSKFTNKELYDWMIGQISSVYFKSYQLAHDFAKKAERCYRFELGNDDSYISYGYWDNMKKGLQSADALIHDIKRMETGYLDKNKREYEITKHVSLAQLDPLALIRLRATGICDFEIPEVLYDMDFPGQYFRRLKSVSVSLPCIAGPYTSVSAKMSLVHNRYRKHTDEATGYVEVTGNDNRFIYNIGAIQSIATSNAQNDNGVFELNFRDERYLPFEGTGAISSWRLELPTEVKQFDYNTISDVIVHIKYTAREGGSNLKSLANAVLIEQMDLIKQGLNETGLHVAINMKHDLPNEWYLFKNNGTIDLTIDKSRLPYMVQPLGISIENVMFVAKVTGNPANFVINVDANAPTNLSSIDDLKLNKGISSDIDLDTTFTLSMKAVDKVKLEEMIMVIKYGFS